MSVAGPLIAPPTVSPATHAAATAELVRRYRAVPAGTPVRLGKPSSNLFRFGAPAAHRLDTSALTGVIGVDPVARTAEVQGMTTYEHLVDSTLPYGLTPMVVPQLKTITVLVLHGAEYQPHGVFGEGTVATSKLLEGFAVKVSDAFAAAKH